MAADQNDDYLLRLPKELKQSLRKVARDNDRSLNAEIVQRLRQSMEAPRRRHRLEDPGAPEYNALTDQDRAILKVFGQLSLEKQLALLSLLK